jgi:hypothetical protein
MPSEASLKRMKTLFLSLICAGLTATASAQIFQPATASNILIGGIAGAIIGDHNHHQALAGAAIGAAAGYVWSAATEPRVAYYNGSQSVPVYYGAGYYAPRATFVVGAQTAYCAPVSGYYYGGPVYYPGRGFYRPATVVWYRNYDRSGRVFYSRPGDRGHPAEYRTYERPVYRR